MGQGRSCCELATSSSRVSIETTTPVRARATSPRDATDSLAPCESERTEDQADESSAPKVDRSHSSEVKLFIKALVHGHSALLLGETGELTPCTLILDKAITKLSVCSPTSKQAIHDMELGRVKDVVTQDVGSLMGFGTGKQYRADVQWLSGRLLSGTQASTASIIFRDQKERDLFASAFAMMCRQSQALGKLRAERDEKPNPFHTAPAKFVHFGETSISDITDLCDAKRQNPIHGTLQKTQDSLKSRPWKPPSLLLFG